jgi:hypothetical protein
MSSDWYARARAILNREWDPIHLSRMPDTDEWNWADEYDHYRDQLAALIEAGVSDDGLLTYMEWAETAFMGLGGPVDRERNAKVVAALRALGPPPQMVL